MRSRNRMLLVRTCWIARDPHGADPQWLMIKCLLELKSSRPYPSYWLNICSFFPSTKKIVQLAYNRLLLELLKSCFQSAYSYPTHTHIPYSHAKLLEDFDNTNKKVVVCTKQIKNMSFHDTTTWMRSNKI